MDLTDEQRRRIEENRARARDRLREKRLGQTQNNSGASGGRVDAPGGAGDVASDSVGSSGSAPQDGGGGGGATNRRLPEERGSGEKGPRGTRAGGGGRGNGSGPGSGGGVSGSGESPAAEAAATAAASCEGCAGAEGDVRVDQELLEGFGVSVCRTCKLSREEFQCVPKREAKENYLLPEGTIAVLKFIERDNPHHTSWTKMKLYLRRDVSSYSYKRWGGEEGLVAEKSRRDALKYDRSLAKTKGVFKRGRSTTEDSGSYGDFLDDFDED